ncbi:HI0074 family nucleotidyltransferase substrate-binding subunit [Aneurinibacillus danicus]|jgi:nucleotidyltransferase substrate binding protein (TIGR01987 family)|uniref:Nucleotidyltransferase n=1 Tax=Aneurinibacillus danicus TaxID=267746 RepID=A0A511V9K3_9BACL|nr:HI0074 family nucleotidyltransferase substrate-binding subunit [Aneurinibacillus danicus]GEN35590.1 nucleotidyltransferase [Aneurinibacillus danicus]
MERVIQRLDMARKALGTFEEVMRIESPSSIERDAAIQRFEYTFEAMWKAAKQVLLDIEGVDVASPKGVIRSCREVQLLNEEEAIDALQMVDDRNLTVHTYNEALSLEIYSRLPSYVSFFRIWLQRLQERSNG